MYDLLTSKLSDINDFSAKADPCDTTYMTTLSMIRVKLRGMMEDVSSIPELSHEYIALDCLLYRTLPALVRQRMDLVAARKTQEICGECGSEHDLVFVDGDPFCVNCARGMK